MRSETDDAAKSASVSLPVRKKYNAPSPAKAPEWGEYGGGTIWIIPAGKNTYQAVLLTRL
jgi:hypothetical protein